MCVCECVCVCLCVFSYLSWCVMVYRNPSLMNRANLLAMWRTTATTMADKSDALSPPYLWDNSVKTVPWANLCEATTKRVRKLQYSTCTIPYLPIEKDKQRSVSVCSSAVAIEKTFHMLEPQRCMHSNIVVTTESVSLPKVFVAQCVAVCDRDMWREWLVQGAPVLPHKPLHPPPAKLRHTVVESGLAVINAGVLSALQ